MKKKLLIIGGIAGLLILLILSFGFKTDSEQKQVTWWEFQSIDTMKYSRDISREKLNDPSFDKVINEQITNIAQTGATHVGIATPYDEEFYPILKRWVNAARKNNLKVWFRGNWSGWEGWFNYPKITRDGHIQKTEEFIFNHKEIFEDGDVFSPCPECENGGPGDPRLNGDVEGHRKFIIEEYNVTKKAFRKIGKNVPSNFNSMNGDVARVVMDRQTTVAMDGIVVVDHYVKTPEKLVEDIKSISRITGGKVVLGEFGAPIPDIHGKMSQRQQSDWVGKALMLLIDTPEVVGVNYWTNTGSSTAPWNEDGKSREVVSVITSVYKAPVVKIIVKDEAGFSVSSTQVILNKKYAFTANKGYLYIPYFGSLKLAKIQAEGYLAQELELSKDNEITVSLVKIDQNLVYKILKFVNGIKTRLF